MSLSKFKVFIFDMDGVLIDSLFYKALSFVEALKKFGVDISVEDVIKYMGMSRWDIGRALIEKFNLDISLEELVETRMKILEKFRESITYTRCAKELLQFLKSKGKILVLATSSNKNSVFKEIPHIIEFFDRIITSDDVKRSKPHPEIYEKAVCGFNKDESIVIEDSPYGIIAAKRAGLRCVGVVGRYRSSNDLIEAGVDYVVKDLCELYEIIKKDYKGEE